MQNVKNGFDNFEPKWPKRVKSGQIRNVNEFLKRFQYFFYQKVYIKMELRVLEFSKTELQCIF